MSARRVVVTGIGVISALGPDRHSFWKSLVAGGSGIAPIIGVDTSRLRCRLGAQVREFEAAAHVEGPALSLYDRFALFALVAARQATDDAGWGTTEKASCQTAVVTGSCSGGVQ